MTIRNPKPTPASLSSDIAEIISNVVGWPVKDGIAIDWREHEINISEMATISARIERLLEQRCCDASEPWTAGSDMRFDL